MIQWLNVRAVHAIKASMFEGRTPLSALPPPLSLFLSLSPFFLLSPLRSLARPLHPPQAGWRGWCADLVIQIRATLSAQGPALSSCVSWIFLFLLSPSSCGQRRPYKATFLLIHFCQFQRCHSNHGSRERREAELAVSLAARTVLFGPS